MRRPKRRSTTPKAIAPQGAPPSAERGARRRLAAITIVLAACLSYSNTYQAEFVLDDTTAIVHNRSIRRWWDLAPVLATEPNTTTSGRPLLNLSLAVNYAISSTEPWSYHVVNLMIHVAAALTLLGLARRTLSLPSVHESLRSRSDALGLAIALLWVVHPLQTESVTYLIQRAESLSGLLYLLVLYTANRGAERQASAHRWSARWWYVASATACVAGVATKETVATAPVVLLLYDRAFLATSWAEAWRVRKWLYITLASVWLCLLWFVAAGELRGGTIGAGYGMSVWDYFRTQWWAIVNYLRLAVWPDRLIFDYGQEVVAPGVRVYLCGLFLAALGLATLAAWRRAPQAAWLGMTFFLLLAPSSSIAPILTQTVAEHRMYLALAPVVAAVVLAADALWRRLTESVVALRATGFVPAVAVLIAAGVLGARTYLRNEDYRTARLLWQDTVAKRPTNPRAWLGVGLAYESEGKRDEAIKALDALLERFPDHSQGFSARGRIYSELGHLDQGIADITRSIELAPRLADPVALRAMTYHRVGDYERALADYDRAIELKSDNAATYYNRGNVHLEQGRLEQAIADYDRAIARSPRLAEAFQRRGSAWSERGDIVRALADLNVAISLDPAAPSGYHARGEALLRASRFHEAVADLTIAIQYAPEEGRLYDLRGMALAGAARHDLAIQDFDRFMALAPASGEAHLNRARSMFAMGRYDAAWRGVNECRRLGVHPDAEFLRKLSDAAPPQQP